jgi:hypothetical protein
MEAKQTSNSKSQDNLPTTSNMIKEIEILDLYDRISKQYQKETSRVHSAYGLLATLLTALIIGSGYLFYNSVGEFKTEMQFNNENFLKNTQANLQAYEEGLKVNLGTHIGVVREKVLERIEDEFKTENMRLLIERKGNELVSKQLTPAFNEMNGQMNELYNSSDTQLKILQFNLYKQMALNDNRTAFDSILTWSNLNNFLFRKESINAIEEIKKEYTSAKYGYRGGLYTDDDKVFSLSDNELKNEFNSAIKIDRQKLLEEYWKRTSISLKDKKSFFIEVIKSDNSLSLVAFASSKLIDEYKLTFRPLDIKEILEWAKSSKE